MKTYHSLSFMLAMIAGMIAGEACQAPGTSGSEDLSRLRAQPWRLVQYTSGLGLTNPISDSEITLHFADKELNGNAGCNSYFGEYEWRGQHELVISGQIGSTKMFCEKFMKQEQLYLMLLSEVTAYSLEDSLLELSGPNGQLVFVAQRAGDNAMIERPQLLTGYYVMGNEVSVFRDCATDTSLTFWLEENSGLLDSLYKQTTDQQEYQPVYMEIEALRQPPLMLGYASEHSGLIQVRRIRKIELPDKDSPCFKKMSWG